MPKHGHDPLVGLHRERRDSSLPKITEVHANLGREQHLNSNNMNTDEIDRFLGITNNNDSTLAKPKSFNDMTQAAATQENKRRSLLRQSSDI